MPHALLRMSDQQMPMSITLRHDSEDQRTLAALDFIDRRRDAARAQVPHGFEAYFQDQALFVSAHSSISIEGNQLGFQELQVVLLEEADSDPNRREAKNAVEAYELAATLVGDPAVRPDQGMMRAFNSVLLKGLPEQAARSRGSFRRGGVRVVDQGTGDVMYNPPPPHWLPDLMDSLDRRIAEWMSEDPPEIAAAKAHFGFVSVHPFADGNGRTARLIADVILQATGRAADGMISVTGILLERREGYYAALRESQGGDFQESLDVTAFVRFHTESLVAAIERLEARAQGLQRRRELLESRYPEILNPRRIIGLMYLYDLNALTSAAWARFTGCAQPTAVADLNELIEEGIVARLGASRSTRYELAADARTVLGG